MLRRAFLLCVFAAAGCSRKPEPKAEVPAPAALLFPDSEGGKHDPLTADGRKATVLLFLMHDCPVVNATAPAMARLAADFTPRGVPFYAVYASETAEEINTHRRDYRLPFPGLLDASQQLARRTGATRVPEAVVLSPSGEVLYRGRIDDRAVSLGVMRPEPRIQDLRLALDTVLAGKKPDPQVTEAVGCYLPPL